MTSIKDIDMPYFIDMAIYEMNDKRQHHKWFENKSSDKKIIKRCLEEDDVDLNHTLIDSILNKMEEAYEYTVNEEYEEQNIMLGGKTTPMYKSYLPNFTNGFRKML